MPTDDALLKEQYFRMIEDAIKTIGLPAVLRLCERACLARGANITAHTSGAGVHTAANWNTAASRCVANISLYPITDGYA